MSLLTLIKLAGVSGPPQGGRTKAAQGVCSNGRPGAAEPRRGLWPLGQKVSIVEVSGFPPPLRRAPRASGSGLR